MTRLRAPAHTTYQIGLLYACRVSEGTLYKTAVNRIRIIDAYVQSSGNVVVPLVRYYAVVGVNDCECKHQVGAERRIRLAREECPGRWTILRPIGNVAHSPVFYDSNIIETDLLHYPDFVKV